MLDIIVPIIIGLIIFLFGLESFSNEIKKITSERFIKILRKAVSNRFTATGTGLFITAILQSSTATTLITLSLINAGFISFVQSLGIIFGSSIGSTITVQLVALKLTFFAPIFIIIGFLLTFFKGKYKYIGKGMFYFGLIFFGLTLVSNSVEPLKNDMIILNYFSQLSNIFIAIFIGFLFTAITHSSALTIGIVIVLSSAGMINLNQGIPILLGANLGSTVTTFIASLKLNLYAKRMAVAHVMFNILRVFLILPFLEPYTNLISTLGGTVQQQIANAHTIFNVFSVIIFLIFTNPFRRVVEALVPGREEEILLNSKYLSEKVKDNNEEAFEELEKEIKYLINVDVKMFEISKQILDLSNEKKIVILEKYGTLSNILTKSIGNYLYELSQRKLTDIEAKKVLYLIRISNELEQFGDIAEDLGLLPRKLIDKGMTLPKESNAELKKIYDKFDIPLKILQENFPSGQIKIAKRMTERKKFESLINKSYKSNIPFLKGDKQNSATLFVESVSIFENAVSKLRGILNLIEKYEKINKN